MKAPFPAIEKTTATAEGSTCSCDSRKSLVQVGKVAGATWACRWCDLGVSLVRLGKVTGATKISRRCDFGAAQRADEKSFRKSAHNEEVDVNACSSFNPNTEDEMSTETYKTIDKLVRKWSYLFNLDDHHAGKLRKSLENRAECLERKYDPNQCGNYEGYIASCLAKFAGCDASRAKDQQSARGEVSLDEPVNGEDADAATRLDFVANDERVVAAKRRAKDVWEAVALLPPAYRRICEWIMDGWSDGRIAFQLGMHRTTFKRFVFPKVRAAFIALYGERR